MLYLTKLKTILQSKITYLILLIFCIIYIFLCTVLIKYESKINENIIEGIVISLSINEDNISFVLKTTEKVKCTYYDEDTSKYKDLLGKRVRITGTKKELYNNTISNTFNYKKYLYNNKIYLSFNVESIEVLEDENVFYKLKNKLIDRIDTFDELTKTYLNLFILGNKDLLDEDMYKTYRTNGIWHLFAISGMHISLIILLLDKLLGRIKLKKVIIVCVLFYFMFLTGFSASVQRTTIFYFLKSILEFWDIKLDSKKLLYLTAFFILLINPFMIYNNGFQYSFLITLTLMMESKYITGSYFKKIFKISLISFVISLPITVNMNYEINLLSVLLNIFYVPFISFVVFPLGIISFIFPFLSFILNFLIYILEFTNQLFYNIKLCLIIPKIPTLIIVLYYLALYIFHKCRHQKYLVFGLILTIINIVFPKLNSGYYMYFLDVGQGDSSILITPYKQMIIMIDTGGIVHSDYHVSDNTILFLKSLGISKIDLLIITHGGMWLVSRIT
ncbi:MAG: DUF4131 domain-containing protein [Firmicutes bacterium]|nr:DUF4131 domain-containing protein [Bacillota bacterium]